MTEPDPTIADYLRQLERADLARTDLDEIEDHLRTLVADLRTTGMPAAAVVAEAARRLGDPRAVAREHARVRTAFGTRLSRWRSYSAVLVFAPLLISGIIGAAQHGELTSRAGVELAFGLLCTLALGLRLSWARPVVFGALAFFAIPSVVTTLVYPANATLLVAQLGVLAFVAPWSRRELTCAGWSLALNVWTYGAASFCLFFQYTQRDGAQLPIAPTAVVAAVAAAIAATGTILRARWAAFASVLSALCLGVALTELWGLRFAFGAPMFGFYIVGCVASGIAAAALGAVLAWRTARSTLGTLHHVLR